MIFTSVLGFAAVFMLQGIILGILRTSGLDGILRIQFAFTTQAFTDTVQSWAPSVKQDILSHFSWDFAMMVAYSAAGYALMYLLLTPKPRGFERLAVAHRVNLMYSYRRLRTRRGLRFLPIIAGVCDLAENLLEISLLNGLLQPLEPFTLLSSIASCGKFLFIFLSLIVGLWTLLRRFSSRHFNR